MASGDKIIKILHVPVQYTYGNPGSAGIELNFGDSGVTTDSTSTSLPSGVTLFAPNTQVLLNYALNNNLFPQEFTLDVNARYSVTVTQE